MCDPIPGPVCAVDAARVVRAAIAYYDHAYPSGPDPTPLDPTGTST